MIRRCDSQVGGVDHIGSGSCCSMHSAASLPHAAWHGGGGLLRCMTKNAGSGSPCVAPVAPAIPPPAATPAQLPRIFIDACDGWRKLTRCAALPKRPRVYPGRCIGLQDSLHFPARMRAACVAAASRPGGALKGEGAEWRGVLRPCIWQLRCCYSLRQRALARRQVCCQDRAGAVGRLQGSWVLLLQFKEG